MAMVLTVEDHAGSRDYLRSLLHYAGHEVIEAVDGEAGLELAHDQHPDLVITDILMPTMDGVEFVRRLRQDPSVGGTPVMFYTASYRLAEAENLARQSGVQRVLAKTAAPADLLHSVEEVLGSARPALDRVEQARLESRLSETRGELDRVSQRLAALLDASRQLLTLESPEELLRRLCELAREIVGARYAVLAAGTDPVPRHVSGLKLVDAGALSVAGLAERIPPASVALRLAGLERPSDAGLPDAHPPLRSLLAARLTGVREPLGLLYCADKVGADEFSEEDEFLLISLANQAATAYEKTRLFAEAERRAQQLAEEVASRLRAEERLLHAQKLDSIGKLAGGISHDFNNLLTVIKGYGEILAYHVKRGDPLHEPTREILSAADRAASLVRQLLAFSRRQVMTPQLLDLNSVVSGMDRLLRRLIGENIELVTFPGPGLGLVRADPGQLEQVVVNLAVNARDAMSEGGKLTLELSNADLDAATAHEVGMEPGSYVRLAVSDTGAGMSTEVQRHIFEPFFTTKEAGKGTGLGLATVYGIVKQSGGHIDVESTLGDGTTFRIYLPVLGRPARTAAPAVVVPARIGARTIRVVEDEEPIRKFVMAVLEPRGYTVLEAADGVEALAMYERHAGAIDLVVTDVVMPRMGGKRLVEKLTARRPDLPVIYMSGYTEELVFEGPRAATGPGFLQKPFAPDALTERVVAALAVRS